MSILGNFRLQLTNPLIIQRFLSTLQDKGLADSTIKRIYNIVNTSLNAAVKQQIINRNAASLIDKPRVKRKEVEVWDVNEVQAFLNYARTFTRYYIAFHLALTTGMRQGEILGLRWMDVDFDRNMISVRQTLSHNGKEIIHGAKTATSIRTISFDSHTATVLQKHMRTVRREMLALGKPFDREDLVVCNGLGTKANPRNINRIWYKLLEKSELKKITFHDLRHTHASLLLKNNTHPKVVSERLGHSSIKITIDLYSHLFPNMQEEAAAELAKMLF
ncbi:tyrosine-type recombinase/integrase [Paenibacillus sp. sgz302251]|uniref:tyrosine-type recombinase/integrase n=1 Tax=Paenibacillus sp. sgz302251 TaxID=3414493 RepID=UPI003C7BBA08